MERYSTLWGTDKAGVYGRQGTSNRLGNFLTQKIGGSNVKDVVDITEKILTGFKSLPGYELEDLDNKPLAVVFSPMYLKNKHGMPADMKAFCALSVNGMENRTGRKESNYAHTFFFSQQDMLKAEEYNYLDLLMGTYQVTCRDVKAHRDGVSRINFEQAPNKVSPVMRNQDVPLVIQTIEQIYKGRNVVIALEKKVSFNRRAMEVLTQIYAMMQPVLAAETGFATYQTVDRIQELSSETNVQIYVVPGGTDLSKLRGSKFEILDLDGGQIIPNQTALAMMLLKWRTLEWAYRQRAMEHLFTRSSDYLNVEEFVRLSGEFFAQLQALNTWLGDTGKHGSIGSLEMLEAEDQTHTGWKQIPWAKEFFKNKVPKLLKKGLTVEGLTALSLVEAYEYDGPDGIVRKLSTPQNVDPARRQRAIKEYRYGRELSGIDEAVLTEKVWEKANVRIRPSYMNQIKLRDDKIQADANKHQQEVEQLKTDHTAVITKLNEDHATATAKLNADHAAAIGEQNARHANELQTAEAAMAAAVAAEQTRTAEALRNLDAANRNHAAEVMQLNADHAAAVTQLNNQYTAAVAKLNEDHAAATAKLEADHTAEVTQLKGQYTTAVTQLKEQCAAAITQLNAEHDATMTAKDNAYNAAVSKLHGDHAAAMEAAEAAKVAAITEERRKGEMALAAQEVETGRVNTQLETTKRDLEKMVIAFNEKSDELNKATSVAVRRKQKLDEQEAELDRLGKLLDSKGIDRTPPEPTITLLGVQIPKRALKVIAIAAAAAFLIGALISGAIVGLVTSGKEPEETIPHKTTPVETTTAPTTVPTTAPTTVPATEPTEPALSVVLEDGSVDWELLRSHVLWIDAVETNPTVIAETMTWQSGLPEGWTVEAVIMPVGWTPNEGETEMSDFIAVLNGKDAVDAELKLEELGDLAQLAIMTEGRCVAAHFRYGEDAARERRDIIEAVVGIASLLASENAELDLIAFALEDGRMVDMTEFLTDSLWKGITGISFDAQDLENLQFRLGSVRVPVSIVSGDWEVCVFDYANAPDRASQMVELMEREHTAAISGDFVLILLNEEAQSTNA